MPVNGSAAPVCPISRPQAAPGMPGVRAPPIPTATDLPSLVAAVNTINLIIQQILGPGGVTNNVYPPNMPLSPSGGNSSTSHGIKAAFLGLPAWMQGNTDIEPLEIRHKDFKGNAITEDKTQYVQVQRINTVEFDNTNYNDAPFLWQYHTP